MDANIIFLGTAGDVNAYGKQFRGSGGVVIQVEGYQFHIDPGPGTLVQAKMYDINPRQTTAILVSSSDLLCCNDVNALISAMTLDGIDIQGVLIGSEGFINGTDEERYLSGRHKRYLERVLSVAPEKKIGIEHIEIHTLKTKSPGDGIGFKLFTPKFVLSYTGDTGYSQEIAKQYENSDILIMNVTLPFSEKSDQSLNSEDCVKIMKRVNPRLAVITHFGGKMLSSDPLYESREIQKQTGIQVIAAKDGLVVNPHSYSASLRQKTLNLYS